ncbi:hypothetical protein Pint_22789 [Pistacia integerrima]|uniref:Uncharacterized protein n=1 Tax=Pistacia integerrima TaxID=434235 RepID=A0ACC0YHA9_9ROSI|nr:hypothetical protein Pint_22789 [Pistacia integerrima]
MVDPFIKTVKTCIANENEVVEFFPIERFKVDVELPLSRARYLVNDDKDMNFIFQKYRVKGLKTIKFYVEAIPLTLLKL